MAFTRYHFKRLKCYLNSYVIRSSDRNLIVDTGLNRKECLEAIAHLRYLQRKGLVVREDGESMTWFTLKRSSGGASSSFPLFLATKKIFLLKFPS
jgi:hypothetical protein